MMGYVLGFHKDNMYLYIYLVGVDKEARTAPNHK